VTVPCRDWEPLLLGRVSGELDAAEERRLDLHLSGCAACRAELSALGEALALAELPPVSEGERAVLAGAERSALAEWKRRLRRRRSLAAGAAALAVAAAAIAFAVSPGLVRRTPLVEVPAVAWQPPDLDEAWSEAAIADPSAAGDEASPEPAESSSGDDTLYAELEEIDLDAP